MFYAYVRFHSEGRCLGCNKKIAKGSVVFTNPEFAHDYCLRCAESVAGLDVGRLVYCLNDHVASRTRIAQELRRPSLETAMAVMNG